MSSRYLQTLASCLILGAVVACPLPAEVLIVTRSATGSWSMQRGDSLLVNGKEKVRQTDAAAVSPETWDSKSLNHLPAVNLDAFAVVRRASSGVFLARQENSREWLTLLPEGLKGQAPETAAHLWSGSTLMLKRDKKDKSPAPIPVEELYAIVMGADAGSSAAAFVSDTGLHRVPGIDERQAFANTVALLPVAIKAFPGGEPEKWIREYVQAGMADRMRIWSEGDAPLETLDECIALADASESAFPSDPKQAALRNQARESRKAIVRRVAILGALESGRQSDAFLLAYRGFEPYDRSFPDLSTARLANMQASAASHMEAAETARAAGDYATAIHHLRIAQWRTPQSSEAANKLEQVRLEVARLSSQQFAELRRGIDSRSPKQVQMQRRLLITDQYLNDGKTSEALSAIKEAAAIDKEEPRIQLLQAKLAMQSGDLARALALLDLFAGLAVNNQDFDDGEKLRASVQYKIESSRKEARAQLGTQMTEQRFAGALETAANGLKLDNEDTQFLFQAGVNACILRNCDQGVPLLRRFLDITDSAQGKREQRIAAMRLLRRIELLSKTAEVPASAAKSWFSGASLPAGVFYDPVSLAFQPKVAHVKGSSHLNVIYDWTGDQLKSVHTKYEDKKTGTNILKVVAAGAAASQGIGSTVTWRTADRETNDFYFNYYDDDQQVYNVGRDNVITKSRTIPINIPGVGGFGGIGAIGSLAGGLGALSHGMGGLTSMAGGMGGFGGVSGFGGVGGAGALRALATSQSVAGKGGMGKANLAGMLSQPGSYQTASIRSDPQGGSTTGLVTLWNSPRLDTEVAFLATGKRVAVAFSGNSYFQPFVWDAIHSFEVDYDEQGRMRHAWELYNPAAPRLDFTWEGKRLMRITGHAADGGATMYSRTLQYSGDKLMSEAISFGGKTAHIKYKYDKQDRLTEADCEEDHSLDGRSRQIEFSVDAAKGSKR